MAAEPSSLVCDKCGHFDWNALSMKLSKAVWQQRPDQIWVPSAVYDHMKGMMEHRQEMCGVQSMHGDSCKLLYRGVWVRVCDYYEPVPLPGPNEKYLIVNRNGSFLYEWLE